MKSLCSFFCFLLVVWITLWFVIPALDAHTAMPVHKPGETYGYTPAIDMLLLNITTAILGFATGVFFGEVANDALSTQDPALKKPSCFWRHTWSKWKDKMRSDIYNDVGWCVGHCIFQERRCSVCDQVDGRSRRFML
jgi:hypothetical protein